MLKQNKRTNRNITLSLSRETIQALHMYVNKRGFSRFVEDAVNEKLQARKNSLEAQYKEAAADEARNSCFQEWDRLSGDGLNEENEW